MSKKLLISISVLIALSCKTANRPNEIVDRCDDCIYLNDYINYENNKGSKFINSEIDNLFENVFEHSVGEDNTVLPMFYPLKCFIRKDKSINQLNTLVCYEYEEIKDINYNYIDTLVRKELYKFFIKEGHLDSAKINYPDSKAIYSDLQKYFKNLTSDIPKENYSEPKNFDYIKNRKIKKDVATYVDVENQVFYTMTVNSSAFKDFYHNQTEEYTFSDMGIYVTYLTETPSLAFTGIYNSTKSAKDFIESESYSKGKLKKIYSSLDSIERQRLKVIRKNRGLIPFRELIDSVSLYRNKWLLKKKNNQ